MGSLKNRIHSIPGSSALFKIYRKAKFGLYYRYIKNREALFTDYYTIRNWGEHESHSGPGSTVAYTANIREQLPKLFTELQIKTLLDAPCGDFNWFRLITQSTDFRYIGADIVEPLIRENKEKYEKQNITFQKTDIVADPLPKADLWLCRDCWIHFSDNLIHKSISNFLHADIPYLLTTTYASSRINKNISTGEHRFLNLQKAPFHFPEPLLILEDWIEGHPPKQLALWKKEQIIKIKTWDSV